MRRPLFLFARAYVCVCGLCCSAQCGYWLVHTAQAHSRTCTSLYVRVVKDLLDAYCNPILFVIRTSLLCFAHIDGPSTSTHSLA